MTLTTQARLALGALAATSAAVLLAPPAAAGQTTGSTELLGPPVSGTTVLVDVSVVSTAPVVPYEYAYVNRCSLPHRSGTSLQRDDIVAWTLDVGGVPHATVPVDLGSVPSGSACTVFLVRNNTVVKGSSTAYTVL